MTGRSSGVRVGMVVPPVDATGVVDCNLNPDDVRVPRPLGRVLDPRDVVPVGYDSGCATGPCGDRGRHLFDALLTSEGDRYGEGEELVPSAFRMVLTCVECGVVVRLGGALNPDRDDYSYSRVTTVDPVPLRAGVLSAQQVSRQRGYGADYLSWSVYQGREHVGWMVTERGPRGAWYVAGRLGRRYEAASEQVLVRGASPIGVLRKLARLAPPSVEDRESVPGCGS